MVRIRIQSVKQPFNEHLHSVWFLGSTGGRGICDVTAGGCGCPRGVHALFSKKQPAEEAPFVPRLGEVQDLI